jgi:hypothetical protein
MPDFACPNCGQNALSIATRCPHCGQPFESRLWQSPAPGSEGRRMPAGLVITGVVIVLVVVGVAQRESRGPVSYSSAPQPAATREVAPPPPPAVVRPAQSAPPIDSVSLADATPAAAKVAKEAVPAPAPTPVEAPAADESLERRYASTWVNVRAGRSGSAPVVQILKPGEAVGVDSLRQGWYRVVDNGRRLGYVDRSLVGATPESVSP